MGEQRKKIRSWRYGMLSLLVVFACFMMAAGFGIADLGQAVAQSLRLNPTVNPGDVCYWGIDDSQWGVYMEGVNSTGANTYAISTQGQLAWMRYELTHTGSLSGSTDFSNYTFVLTNDIDLERIRNANKSTDTETVYDYPRWLPIDIGNLGKNQNITFDGNGHSIKGMHIVYDDKCTSPNVGFFANLVGGVIKNVNFVNPIIEYQYSATSYAKTDFNRPKKPTDVSVGVIAGAADGTYIQDVNIINPTVTFTVDNVNAHNFYVGTAVGKLSLTTKFENVLDENGNQILDEEQQPVKKVSINNTVSPSQWGLDSVNVSKNSAGGDTVGTTITINPGSAAGTTYGQATYGYFGGLVGANISSKVINSTIKNYDVTPVLNQKTTEGTYHIGGLVGLTTQITTDENLIAAAGLYNNLLLDVNLASIGVVADIERVSTTYCGDLVGRIYSGGWVYNNIVAGGSMPYTGTITVSGKTYQTLWGQVYNSYIFVTDDEGCVGHVNGALDYYYFDNNGTNYIGDSDCTLVPAKNGSEIYYHCAEHQSEFVQLNSDPYGKEETMAKYNHYFATWNGNDEYLAFINNNEYYIPQGEEKGFSQFQLMSSTICDDTKQMYGAFYAMSLPILKYETGLTVNEIDEVTKNPLTADEKMLASVYQFKTWGTDSSNHNAPTLGNYLGVSCNLHFITNNQYDLLSDAYFAENTYDKVHDKLITRTFQQLIVKPSVDPVCVGYDFVGWKIKIDEFDALIADKENNIKSYVDITKNDYIEKGIYEEYLNDDGTYDFEHSTERIIDPERYFVAVWKLNTYTVTFMVKYAKGDTLRPGMRVRMASGLLGRIKEIREETITLDIDENGNTTEDSFEIEAVEWVEYTKYPSEAVIFGRWVKGPAKSEQPTSNLGYNFAGWYLEQNLPEEGEAIDKNKRWVFSGEEGNPITMPGRDIILYAGWEDNFTELRTLVDDNTYIKYNDNYAAYFEDTVGNAYHNAYEAALLARENNDNSDVDRLLANLKSTYAALRVDPKKLLNTRAFDESLIENSCPFLYDSNFYLSYKTFKETVEKEAAKEDEATLKNIDSYITYYERINELFDELSGNLKSSIVTAGGIDSEVITNLIEKYQKLEERYAALYSDGENTKYDTTALDDAEQLAKKRWTEINKDLVLKDVETVVANYENAFNNLQVKSVINNNGTSNNNETVNNKTSKSGISPVTLSIIIVAVLAAGVFGYIGIDVVLNKHRAKQLKVQNSKSKKTQEVPDEDTYI